MKKTCFLFRHRDAPDMILQDIKKAAEEFYFLHDIRCFIVGGYGNFDRLAGIAIKAVQEQHSDIGLRLLIPYHPAVHPVETPTGFEGTLYPEGMELVPRKYAIVKANQYMVRSADAVICYVNHFGNTRELLNLAISQGKKRKIPVNNLAVHGESLAKCIRHDYNNPTNQKGGCPAAGGLLPRSGRKAMRLQSIQTYLRQKNIPFQYSEEDDCGSIDFVHRGLSYHIWEYPAPERGAESNVRTTGRSEEFGENYEQDILDILRSW